MDISQDIIRKDEETSCQVNCKLPEGIYDILVNTIKPWYRSASIAHTLKLMIEDVGKAIEQNGGGSPAVLKISFEDREI